ncbi:hypothetical protein A3709_02470 [Halioglobus sp. HI00S01]|uniref:lycopene cyclase family protein n=1 Tax=Halioglobus sp. HI00S01 TaxID=1822214 RepID=UPI0007C32249|nr:lycopene cyclase family protein [Halioglobus sp. HI00S01]KZX58345.1 hypothetical protein A3709_02470 [Halioglobus sp. HI00S01]
MNHRSYDLVIVGGGCAGLSLARNLAVADLDQRVLILEPRSHYRNDRTWCFWESKSHALQHLVSNHWNEWLMDTADGEGVSHRSYAYSYQAIRSSDFYRDAQLAINNSGRCELRLDTSVTHFERGERDIFVHTNDSVIRTRAIVDTRNDPAIPLQKPHLYQCFSGVEIETDRAIFKSASAGLMTDMSTDADGFRFRYILPFSGSRALVETTRFSPSPRTVSSLDSELEQDLNAVCGHTQFQIKYREGAILPMGWPQPKKVPDQTGRIVQAGIAGGALRPSSGYGFARIQTWAELCTRHIRQTGLPCGHPPQPGIEQFMDRIFLQALVDRPDQGGVYFLQIARALGPRRFAIFMSGKAGMFDWLRVAWALPSLPFMRAARKTMLSLGSAS